MPYLIDGHNLIPHLPGLSLNSIDDELQLVEWLQNFTRKTGRPVEVFFDGAPPGHSGTRRYSRVTAHCLQQGRSADEAIRLRLRQLAKGARNWTVVSSDNQVQAEARAVRAGVIPSEAFARQLQQIPAGPPKGRPGRRASSHPEMSPEELREWLRLFGRGEDET